APREFVVATSSPHRAVRLCLNGSDSFFLGGYASSSLAKAQPRQNKGCSSERHSLSALCGGKAALMPRSRGFLSRQFLYLLLAFVFLLFPGASRAQDTPADNWSQFRGNPSLTGVSQASVPSSLKLLWTVEAGDSIESSAAIVGSTVFVGSQ